MNFFQRLKESKLKQEQDNIWPPTLVIPEHDITSDTTPLITDHGTVESPSKLKRELSLSNTNLKTGEQSDASPPPTERIVTQRSIKEEDLQRQ